MSYTGRTSFINIRIRNKVFPISTISTSSRNRAKIIPGLQTSLIKAS